MRATPLFFALAAGLTLVGTPTGRAPAEEVPAEYRATVTKGLEWLARQQQRDGHWEAAGGAYPVAMTAFSGIALLMEGSTLREGRYKDHLRRATDWLLARSQPNGLIGDPVRYMHNHGYAMLFLSCVVGEEGDEERRRRIVDVLERAVKFSRDAQTNRGGWGYVSGREGNNFDEGSVTVTQVQALRAARNAGIIVPREAITDALKYLKDSTNTEGGVIYSLAHGAGGDGRPALTAAAIACGFSAGEYHSDIVKRWFKFCRGRLRILGDGRMGHDEYTNYYYAQAVYMLGEDGWARMFPNDRDPLRWSEYRKATFHNLAQAQSADGSWPTSTGIGANGIGPIYTTALCLTILQLDKGTLPIFQR
jgi:hypothetical protein